MEAVAVRGKIKEAMYRVQASEPFVDSFVTESELRNEIHGLFCCCDSPSACDSEYLADFDDSFPGQWKESGGHWDLEDGWVRFLPVKTLFCGEEIDGWCCELGAPEYVQTDDGEAWYWRFSGRSLPVADNLAELFSAARSLGL